VQDKYPILNKQYPIFNQNKTKSAAQWKLIIEYSLLDIYLQKEPFLLS